MGEVNDEKSVSGQKQPESQPQESLLPGVRHIIAVGSGKGGVGKSTVTANLAVALGMNGLKVGLMDADIYGPNIPMMLGVTQAPEKEGEKIRPAEGHGIKIMSMGFFVPEETPVVWRGPMIHSAIQQFFRDVLWGELDYLLIDLPPGTGDVQLTLSQLVPLTGAITVTTPQAVALHDVRKGIMMFKKVNVPILGVIENMSYFLCGHCGERSDIFSTGGGQKAAETFGVPFLGSIPIDPAIRQGGDTGMPIVIADPSSAQAKVFKEIATSLAEKIGHPSTEGKSETPSIHNLLKKIKEPLETNS